MAPVSRFSLAANLDVSPTTPAVSDFTRNRKSGAISRSSLRNDFPAGPLDGVPGVPGLDRVDEGDDFFALGGHSLMATQVMSRIRGVFGVEIPLRGLFEAPRLGELARAVEAAQQEAGDPKPELVAEERPDRIPLSHAQQRLWFIDQLRQGESTEYNMPAGFLLRGNLDPQALRQAIQSLVARHERLRNHFAVIDGEPFQVIQPELDLPLPVQDLSALDEASRQAVVAAELERESS